MIQAQDRFRCLSEGQRACLRLVFQQKSSKEIARELGIAKDTVDQRLDRARKLLGCATRIEASRAFAAWEREYHRVVYDSQTVASAPPDPAFATTAASDQGLSRSRPAAGEPEAPNQASPGLWAAVGSTLRYRLEERNDLGVGKRLIYIALLAVAIPMLLGSLMLGLWALGQIVSALVR